jgi:hypothetical protein
MQRLKSKGKTLGFAQTQQGNNSPAPLIVKAFLFFAVYLYVELLQIFFPACEPKDKLDVQVV